MALIGQAVMINWSNVPVEHRDEYYEWHDREHMAGRLTVPGFKRGRRHIALDANRDIFNLYEVEDLAVLTSGPYTALTQNPTEATRRVGKVIVDAIRALANVKFTTGVGVGGFVHTLRFDAIAGRGDTLTVSLAKTELPRLAMRPGVVAVHLCVADHAASTVVTTERKGRPTEVPNWSVIIEGTSMDAASAAGESLRDDMLAGLGASGPAARGTYVLQRLVMRHDVA